MPLDGQTWDGHPKSAEIGMQFVRKTPVTLLHSYINRQYDCDSPIKTLHTVPPKKLIQLELLLVGGEVIV